MAITLYTIGQISSFFDILYSRPDVASLVHHLWAAPLRRISFLGAILRACTNVRVLACGARSLVASIAKPSKFKHGMCRDLTLLLSRPKWETHLNTPHGLEFTRWLTHLRVISEAMTPRMSKLPKVILHSGALDYPEILLSQRTIVLTQHCGPVRGPPERIGPRLVLHLSRESVEMQTWCDGEGVYGWSSINPTSTGKRLVFNMYIYMTTVQQ